MKCTPCFEHDFRQTTVIATMKCTPCFEHDFLQTAVIATMKCTPCFEHDFLQTAVIVTMKCTPCFEHDFRQTAVIATMKCTPCFEHDFRQTAARASSFPLFSSFSIFLSTLLLLYCALRYHVLVYALYKLYSLTLQYILEAANQPNKKTNTPAGRRTSSQYQNCSQPPPPSPTQRSGLA